MKKLYICLFLILLIIGCSRGTGGKISLGMDTEQVLEVWGNPNDVNRSVGSWGVHEQWVYDYQYTYLYFEDGILTSYQSY